MEGKESYTEQREHDATAFLFTNGRYYAACSCGWRTAANCSEQQDAQQRADVHAAGFETQSCRGCGQSFPYDAEADYCPACVAVNEGRACPVEG